MSREREEHRGGAPHVSANTNSDNPKLLMSRVFIGNLPSDRVTRGDIENIFQKYGKILGVSILRGYGFVQYETEEDARRSVNMENGGLLKGNKLDVKMAIEGRKGAGGRGGGRGGRGGPPARHSPPPRPGGRDRERDRSPVREYAREGRDHYRDRERERDRERDRFRDRDYDRDEGRRRDSYGAEGLHSRGRSDPYLDRGRDPYPRDRLDPYPARVDPLRDPLGNRPPVDCEILCLGRKAPLRAYADALEQRLRRISMLTAINVLPDEAVLPRAMEDCTRRRLLYAIVIGDDNELHRSITLNILHGTPQEHRNMPLDNAIALVTRNFEAHNLELKEKASRPQAPPPGLAPTALEPASLGAPKDFIAPDEQTAYLIHLLADNRLLSVTELDVLINYLTDRRDRMMEAQGLVPPKKDIKDDKAIAAQQQELQHKILSILNGGENDGPKPPSPTPAFPTPSAAPIQQPPASVATSINFDNPNVQKALDNLISSGPNLLKNISPISPTSTQTPPLASPRQPLPGQPQLATAQHMHLQGAGVGLPMGFGGIGMPEQPGLLMEQPRLLMEQPRMAVNPELLARQYGGAGIHPQFGGARF